MVLAISMASYGLARIFGFALAWYLAGLHCTISLEDLVAFSSMDLIIELVS
jgi:hypothetical protein